MARGFASRVSSLTVAALCLMAATRAGAQEQHGFGHDRPLVVSLENLGGFTQIRTEFDEGEAETFTYVGTHMAFLGPLTPMHRLGVHYFVAPPISIGGIFHYSDNDFFGTNYMAGVRIGGAFPLSEATAIWVRGGIAYVAHDSVALGTLEFHDVRPGAEVLFALSPIEHFGFLVGGMFEIGIAGKRKLEVSTGLGSRQTIEDDYEHMEYGLTLGVYVDF